jgi:histidinol dehydrogenase
VRVKRLRLKKGRDATDLAAEIRALTPPPEHVREAVAEIVEDVRTRGDKAVGEWTARFEGTRPRRASEGELQDALESLEGSVRAGLETAIENVRRVAEAELREAIRVELPEGQTVELRELPVGRAGIYAPGGRAAYPSTVVMCSVPARAAGVDQLAVVTPGSEVILAACALCGVDEVHLVGGAQAIAALAYGTETIDPVDVIVGPGNAFVQEAKRQVFGVVGVDGIAGPSELVVVAEEDADARLVALDLAAQSEHGNETLLVLLSPSERLLELVEQEAALLSRRAESVSDAPLALVRTADLETAAALAGEIAPEHLELALDDAGRMLPLVRAAGCVFCGPNGGAAFGDYVAGSNHVLPTGGAARFAGPLGASTFRRRQALVSLPDGAVKRLAPRVGAIARAEGFPVHGESAEARRLNPNPRTAG